MTLLSGRLECRGVDMEKLCRKAFGDYVRATKSYYRVDHEEDAISYLLGIAWRLPELYEAKARSVSFVTYSYRLLRLRCTDWQRETHGRTRWQFSSHTYEREPRIAPLSLDGPAPGAADNVRLGELIADGAGDRATDRLSPHDGLLGRGDRELARDQALIRAAVARRARHRDRRLRAA